MTRLREASTTVPPGCSTPISWTGRSKVLSTTLSSSVARVTRTQPGAPAGTGMLWSNSSPAGRVLAHLHPVGHRRGDDEAQRMDPVRVGILVGAMRDDVERLVDLAGRRPDELADVLGRSVADLQAIERVGEALRAEQRRRAAAAGDAPLAGGADHHRSVGEALLVEIVACRASGRSRASAWSRRRCAARRTGPWCR